MPSASNAATRAIFEKDGRRMGEKYGECSLFCLFTGFLSFAFGKTFFYSKFASNPQAMNAAAQKLVLTVPPAKMAALLEVLKQYEFVQVENLDEIISRFIRNAPKNAPVSEDEIAEILMEMRYGKPSPTPQ